MGRTRIGALALPLVMILAGCGASHRLDAPSRMPPPGRADCRIGVARFNDETGLDLALDLRDYLRQVGPCRTVLIAAGPDDDRADLVVTGEARVKIERDLTPGAQAFGIALTSLGLAGMAGGGVLAGVNALPGRERDEQYDAIAQASLVSLIAGGALTVVGIGALLVDSGASRGMKASSHVEADVEITQAGGPSTRFALKDDVVSRARHASERPEARDAMHASGPLYRELYVRIFEHVAARIGDVLGSRR